MITGVVKLAPQLPVDGAFPFFHLDRKFMHLGFHIYDVGFQSPNVEASKPMVLRHDAAAAADRAGDDQHGDLLAKPDAKAISNADDLRMNELCMTAHRAITTAWKEHP